MDGWRRQGDSYNQEGTRFVRPNHRKPPLGGWQPTVPAWEKRFCASVGSLPWGKLMEAKRFIHLYDNVVNWNDSAGEEAFCNAKQRFYASIRGMPCDLSLPDPDIYIDKIDWDSEVDPELLLDLECSSMVPDAQKDEKVVIFGDSFFSRQGFSSAGWGDYEEEKKKVPNTYSENNDNLRVCSHDPSREDVEADRWGDFNDNNNNYSAWANVGNNDNAQAYEAIEPTGWGDVNNDSNNVSGKGDSENYNSNPRCWDKGNRNKGEAIWRGSCNDSWGWNEYVNKTNNTPDGAGGNHGWGWRDVDSFRKDGNGRYMSRYKTSRFRGDDGQRNNSCWGGNGRKRVNAYAPVGHHDSGKGRYRGSWRPVS